MDKRLLVLASGMFAIGTDSFVVAGVLGQVSASLGVTVAVAGQMVTLYALSYALLSPVIATAAANWPRKRLLLMGLVIFVIGNVITALARLRWLFVIARNSSFVYKGKAVDVRQVARELGVRYVLEGSIRTAGHRIRITGQLIDAETGKHIWAEKYMIASCRTSSPFRTTSLGRSRKPRGSG